MSIALVSNTPPAPSHWSKALVEPVITLRGDGSREILAMNPAAHGFWPAGVCIPASWPGQAEPPEPVVLEHPNGRIACSTHREGDWIHLIGDFKALVAERDLLEAILDQLPDCVKVVHPSGRLLRMNRTGLEMLEAPNLDAVNAAGFSKYFSAEDQSSLAEMHEAVCAGESRSLVVRLKRASGERYLEIHALPFADPASGDHMQLAITRDITPSVVDRDSLRMSEIRLAEALAEARIGQWCHAALGNSPGAQAERSVGPCGLTAPVPLMHWRSLLKAADQRRLDDLIGLASSGIRDLDDELELAEDRGWIWIRGRRAAQPEETLHGVVVDVTDRKRADLAAALAQERLRHTIEAIGDGVWEWDIPENRFTFSRRWAELIGESFEDLRQDITEWTGRLHPDDRDAILHECAVMVDLPHTLEHRLRHRDGSYVWVMCRSVVSARDGHGAPRARIGVVTSIDREKADLAHIHHLNQRLELAIRGSGFGVWEFDPQSNRLIWDATMHEIYGVEPGSFDGDPGHWRELLHQDDRALVDQRFNDLMNGTRVDLFVFRILRASDGALRFIEANGILQQEVHGQSYRLVGMNRDVTDRFRAEREIRLLGTSLSRLHDMVVIREASTPMAPGRIIYANETFLSRTGYRLDEVETLHPRALIDAENSPDLRERLRTSVVDAPGMREEMLLRPKHGRSFWIELDVIPVIDDQGIASHWVMIGHDISERKLREREIELNQLELERRVAARTAALEASNQELKSFTYAVSHDLRAPLRGLDGWSQALLEDCADLVDETARGHIARIRGEARRLADLVEGLLRLARISQTDLILESVDLVALVQSVCDRQAAEHADLPLHLTMDIRHRALGDPVLLRLMFTNLIDNAFKFSRRNGSVRIEVSSELMASGAVRLRVRDYGAGFDPDRAGDLFQPFRRLHRQQDFPGTGIGLAVVERIVRRHGGYIAPSFHDAPGACFVIELPQQ